MKHNRLFLASILAVAFFAAQDGHAQWVKTNYASGGVIVTIGTDVMVGTNINFGPAFFLSTDYGSTWGKVVADLPTDHQLDALVSSGMGLFAGTYGNGVFLSTDKGATWTAKNTGLPNKYITAIFLNGTTLFAGVNLVQMNSASIYRSTDNGESWNPADAGIPVGTEIDAFAANSTTLFAGMGYRSTDNGTNWSTPNTQGIGGGQLLALSAVGPTIFAGTTGIGGTPSVWRSTDNGINWNYTLNLASNGMPWNIDVNTFAVIGTNIFAGTSPRGVFLSTNYGGQWSEVNAGLTDTGIIALAVSGSVLFAVSASGPVWRRSLSEMISAGVVSQPQMGSTVIKSYPNPFSQRVTLSLTSSESRAAEITIVNLLGNEVSRIFSGELAAGEHSFTWDANGMPPGTYWCQVRRVDGQTFRTSIELVR